MQISPTIAQPMGSLVGSVLKFNFPIIAPLFYGFYFFMDFIFADDSQQPNPKRDGMGPLVATGGFYVKGVQRQL